jgi:predicted DNA-binding protein YlxM (UPF0122 family)
LLFLGACASHAFGIGQLQDFTMGVENVLAELGYRDLLDHIRRTVLSANQDYQYFSDENEIDMEVILSVLELLVQPTEAAADGGGPRIMYLNELASGGYHGNIPNQHELETIKQRIENIIIESCNKCDFERALEYYRRLFSFESSISLNYVNALGLKPHIGIFRHVATTNYDLILERYDKEYCKRFRIDRTVQAKHFLQRGFTHGDYQWNEPYLDLSDIDPKTNPDSITYVKLHGSIDWWIRRSDKKVITRECPTSLMGEVYDKRLMVYPAYDKRTTRDPFSSLHNIFQRILHTHDVFVVVGYSFRDFSINEAFQNILEKNEGSRMVIINRNLKRIRNRIQSFPSQKIDLIEIPFGDIQLIDRLEEVLTRPPSGADK